MIGAETRNLSQNSRAIPKSMSSTPIGDVKRFQDKIMRKKLNCSLSGKRTQLVEDEILDVDRPLADLARAEMREVDQFAEQFEIAMC